MKVNVPNPQSGMLGDALGIPEERQAQISNALDEMATVTYLPAGGLHPLHDILAAVAEPCETTEELLYAVINHLRWLRRQGLTSSL